MEEKEVEAARVPRRRVGRGGRGRRNRRRGWRGEGHRPLWPWPGARRAEAKTPSMACVQGFGG